MVGGNISRVLKVSLVYTSKLARPIYHFFYEAIKALIIFNA